MHNEKLPESIRMQNVTHLTRDRHTIRRIEQRDEGAWQSVTHINASLPEDTGRIVRNLEAMAVLVEELLHRSIRAHSELNRHKANSVISGSRRVGELGKEAGRLCLEYIAGRRAPAKALSFVYRAIKVAAVLEHASNCSENVARQVLTLCELDVKVPNQHFEELANVAIEILTSGFRAFVAQAPETAILVMKQNERAKHLSHQLGVQLLQIHREQESQTAAVSSLISIKNALERTTENARHICQDVLYQCTADYLKHPSGEVFRILFVDDDNSCVSQIAEAIGSSLEQSQFVFGSAGLQRKPIDMGAVEFLKHRGIDISRHCSRALAQVPFLEHYQVIVALSEEARRVLPSPPTKVVCLDWSQAIATKFHRSCEPKPADYSALHDYLFVNVRGLARAALGDSTQQQPLKIGSDVYSSI